MIYLRNLNLLTLYALDLVMIWRIINSLMHLSFNNSPHDKAMGNFCLVSDRKEKPYLLKLLLMAKTTQQY